MSSAQREPRDWAMLMALVAMWGTTFMVVEIALRSVPVFTMVAARLVVSSALLFVIIHALGLRLPQPAPWRNLVVLASFGNIFPFCLIAWGQQSIDSSLAGILIGSMPLWTLLGAHLFVPGEQLDRRKVAGFLLGFAGLMVLFGPEALRLWRGAGGTLAAQIAVLGGALCYAASAVLVKRMPAGHPVLAAGWTNLIAALVVLPVAFLLERPFEVRPSSSSAGATLWLAIGPTAIATIIYFHLIRRTGPTFMSLTNYMAPIVAVFAGAWILGETLRPTALAALCCILGGIALATWRR